MNTQTSLFNLIEIFTKAKTKFSKIISKKEHCEREQLHDFYCDTQNNY